MNSKYCLIVVIIAILILDFSYAHSEFRINTGFSLGQIEMVQDYGFINDPYDLDDNNIYDATNVYGLYGEIVFRQTDKLFLGGGVYYFFNGDEIRYIPPQNVDAPEYDPVKGTIIMPYITGYYNLRLLDMSLITKLNLGFGYAKLKEHDGYNHYENTSNAVGIIPSLGTPIDISSSSRITIEFGYRHIKTDRMKTGIHLDNVSIHNRELDFSGIFFQTGISFGL